MVFVPGGRFAVGVAGEVTLPDFWIDRIEVTNADYKKYVDAGAYLTLHQPALPWARVDEELAVHLRWNEYDRTPLNDRIETKDDSSPHWRRETVTFDAA